MLLYTPAEQLSSFSGRSSGIGNLLKHFSPSKVTDCLINSTISLFGNLTDKEEDKLLSMTLFSAVLFYR